MIPKLICYIFGHQISHKYYNPDRNIGLTPGYDGVYVDVRNEFCPRCGISLAEKGLLK